MGVAQIPEMVRSVQVRPISEGRISVRDESVLPRRLRDRARVLVPPPGVGKWHMVGEFRTRGDGEFISVAAWRVTEDLTIFGTVGKGK